MSIRVNLNEFFEREKKNRITIYQIMHGKPPSCFHYRRYNAHIIIHICFIILLFSKPLMYVAVCVIYIICLVNKYIINKHRGKERVFLFFAHFVYCALFVNNKIWIPLMAKCLVERKKFYLDEIIFLEFFFSLEFKYVSERAIHHVILNLKKQTHTLRLKLWCENGFGERGLTEVN